MKGLRATIVSECEILCVNWTGKGSVKNLV